MDPVCHTLVGATLARTGLERRTPLATATLVIGANIPDVDVVTYIIGPTWALAVRRGVTHGLLALVLWPILLTGAMVLWDRAIRQRLRPGDPPVIAVQLLMLSAIAVVTHPLLDLMNTYGMRWLMPFSGRWFYGDALFIIDPWIWAGLAVGWLAARRRGTTDPAHAARTARRVLLGLVVYVAVLGAAGRIAVRDVSRDLAAKGMGVPDHVMAAPVPVTPFRRFVVVEFEGTYRFGTYRFFGRPRFTLDSLSLRRFVADEAPRGVGRDPEVRRFLTWARFPYADIDEVSGRFIVRVVDARYTFDPEDSWAAVTVDVGE